LERGNLVKVDKAFILIFIKHITVLEKNVEMLRRRVLERQGLPRKDGADLRRDGR
jgi:hypothetical protein